MKSGIYKITNIVNNKIYLGSAIDINSRKSTHFNTLRKNNHHNIVLQRAYNKYGLTSLKFEVILYCSKDYLIKVEQWLINTLKPEYNICKVAGSSAGRKASPETIQKQREKRLGTKRSEETKAKMRTSRKLQVFSQQSKDKMSVSAKKKDLTIAINNIKQSQKAGEENPNATLTNEQVIGIKTDALSMKRKDIVIKYNSNKSIIDCILSGKSWKHVTI